MFLLLFKKYLLILALSPGEIQKKKKKIPLASRSLGLIGKEELKHGCNNIVK